MLALLLVREHQGAPLPKMILRFILVAVGRGLAPSVLIIRFQRTASHVVGEGLAPPAREGFLYNHCNLFNDIYKQKIFHALTKSGKSGIMSLPN